MGTAALGCPVQRSSTVGLTEEIPEVPLHRSPLRNTMLHC